MVHVRGPPRRGGGDQGTYALGRVEQAEQCRRVEDLGGQRRDQPDGLERSVAGYGFNAMNSRVATVRPMTSMTKHQPIPTHRSSRPPSAGSGEHADLAPERRDGDGRRESIVANHAW